MRIFLCLSYLFNCVSFAQDSDQYRNYFGFNFFDLETNAETLQNNPEPKFVTGLVYERKLTKKWSLVNRVDYSFNVIRDLCHNCPDAVYGIGHLLELDVTTGIKYSIKSKRFSQWTYFIEPTLYYSFIKYNGIFEGGWSGGSKPYGMTRNILGAAFRLGINYAPIARIILTATTGLRIGKAWEYSKYVKLNQQSSSGAITAVELRVGFLF